MSQDSTQETLAHIRRVQILLLEVIHNLGNRAVAHDTSKLEEPEKTGFDTVTDVLRGLTYGSDEYKAQLKKLQPCLGHHYANNSHHPEYYGAKICDSCGASMPKDHDSYCPNCGDKDFSFTSNVNAMSLLDVVEMFCDWKAAGERHADGSIMRSIEINKKRFGITDQLASIFENTAKEMDWVS
jgi:hypothetical protein